SGRDADARRVADYGRPGARGDWAAQAAWISGLASWRMNDWNAAYSSFREAATLAREPEFNAAAYYWTARAAQASRRPKEVAPLLKAAARSQESFYGLMAREALGMDKRLPKSATSGDPPPPPPGPRLSRPPAAPPNCWRWAGAPRLRTCFPTRPRFAIPPITAPWS